MMSHLKRLIKNMERRYRETYSDNTKQQYEEFMRIRPCSACHGQRLKPSSLAVTIADKNIYEITNMSIIKLQEFLENMKLSERQLFIGAEILKEIKARIKFLVDVGLDYLALSRATGTLSGGEAQRIRLATQIGSGLVGVAYILDEPSIGLHQRDNDKLLGTLTHLRDLGNSVIVVEHDEDTMFAADYIVDIGPGAEEMVEKLSQQELLRTLWRARTHLQVHICQEESRYLYRQSVESPLAGLR